MTLGNMLKKSLTAAAISSASYLAATTTYADDEEDICKEIERCETDKPKIPARPDCTTLFDNNGQCIQGKIADVLGMTTSKKGYCPGSVNNVCYDAGTVDNVVGDIEANRKNITRLEKMFEELNTYSLMAINDALKEKNNEIKAFKIYADLNCLPQSDKALPNSNQDACALSIAALNETYNNFVLTLKRNLLDSDEKERERTKKIIGEELFQYLLEDLDRTQNMIDEASVKVMIGLNGGYNLSMFNPGASGLMHNGFVGGELSLFFPSASFELGFSGNAMFGTGLSYDSFTNPATVNNMVGDGYSEEVTTKTSSLREIEYLASAGMFAGLYVVGSPQKPFSMSLRLGEQISFGNETMTDSTSTSSQLYFSGDAVGAPHNVADENVKERTLLKSTTYGELNICYNDLGPFNICGNESAGFGITLDDNKDATLEINTGVTARYNF